MQVTWWLQCNMQCPNEGMRPHPNLTNVFLPLPLPFVDSATVGMSTTPFDYGLPDRKDKNIFYQEVRNI
jgi:hypothetical protein